jgi:hypothetical protein
MAEATRPGKPWWILLLVAAALGVIVYAALPAPVPEPSILRGTWMRQDGDYTLEVKSVDPGGRVEAAYLNPKPIRVAAASFQRAERALVLTVELRDEGYPGSTYTLAYDPKSDQLAGRYFQAGTQQSFSVAFVRRQ